MLKKHFLKKITISTAIFFSLFLMCIMPSKNNKMTIKQELEYVDDLNRENIYLLDNNNYLARTSVVIEDSDIEKKAKDLLNVLISEKDENKIPSGFKGILPSNTVINSIEYKNSIIKVSFSSDLLDVKKEYEEKVVEAIIYTLTSIKEVKKVIIYIDDKVLTELPQSKKILPSILDRSFGINKEYDIDSYKDITKVTIYYLNNFNDEYYYVPVTKYLNTKSSKMDIIINELSNNNRLMSVFSDKTKLLDNKIDNKKMYLTFDENIFDDKDERKISKYVIDTLGLTMSDNYDIEEVILNYNNKEILKSVIKTIDK